MKGKCGVITLMLCANIYGGLAVDKETHEGLARNLQECFETLFVEAGHRIEKFEDVTLLNGTSKGPDFNLIVNQGSENKEQIEKSLQATAEIDVPFLFVQDQATAPSNADLLSQFDFSYGGRATCVVIDHDNCDFSGQDDSTRFKVVRVQDDKSFDYWCDIVDESFSMPSGDSRRVFQPVTTYLFNENASHQLFILYDQDQIPISASLLYLPKDKNEDAGHYCWGTVTNQRSKGAMSCLVKEMVNVAKGQGFNRSVAQCYDTSLRLAERLGFVSRGELSVFTNVASKV